MTTAFETGLQPDLNDPQGKVPGDHPLSDRNEVGVIVPTAEPGRLLVPAQRTTNAANLVGRDGFAVAASTQNDSPFTLAVRDRQGGRADEIGIIHRHGAVRPEIANVMSAPDQPRPDGLLVFEPGMIGSDGDFHAVTMMR